jgi:hypothetical protein
MLLPQPLELRLELGFLFLGHSPPPNSNLAGPSRPARPVGKRRRNLPRLAAQRCPKVP